MGSNAFEIAWGAIQKSEFDRDAFMDDRLKFDYPDMRDDTGLVSMYSGIGGMQEGAKRVGIPNILSMDAWDKALDVAQANHPEGEYEQVTFGQGEEGTTDAVLQRILDEVDGGDYHLHGSPPCDEFSMANPHGKGCDEIGMEQVLWYLQLVDQARQSENAPSSWSMEQVPQVRTPLLADNPPWEKPPEYQRELARKPLLTAREFGSPQHRGRFFAGQGWEAQPTHPVGQQLSVHDTLPHLQGEAEENIDERQAMLDALLEAGNIHQPAHDYLMETPMMSMSGSRYPGKGPSKDIGRGGAAWNTGDTPQSGSRAFKHLRPLTEGVSSITHHPPALAYHRFLEHPEVLEMHGFPADFDLTPGQGSHQLSTGTQRDNVNTMLGNVVSPLVAAGVLGGIGRGQRELLDW